MAGRPGMMSKNAKWSRKIVNAIPAIPLWKNKSKMAHCNSYPMATRQYDVELECGHIIQIPKHKLDGAVNHSLVCDFCLYGE